MKQNEEKLSLPSARAPFETICAYYEQEMGSPFMDEGNLPSNGSMRKETTVEELLLRQAISVVIEKRESNLADALILLKTGQSAKKRYPALRRVA